MKVCKDCKETKPLDDFYIAKNKYIARCKICHVIKTTASLKSRKAKNPEKFINRNRDLRLQRDYGISLNEYNEMFSAQEGRCAICFEEPRHGGANGKILCIDHNHNTGKVRGLLCRSCNVAIGLLDDNRKRVLQAAEYLREYEI